MDDLVEVAVEVVGAAIEENDGGKRGCGCIILSLVIAAALIALYIYLE
jgi:hypothetical protein